MVRTLRPAASAVRTRQAIAGAPSTWTVHAPHEPIPQPYFAPTSPSCSRSVSSSVSSAHAAGTRRTAPFTVSAISPSPDIERSIEPSTRKTTSVLPPPPRRRGPLLATRRARPSRRALAQIWQDDERLPSPSRSVTPGGADVPDSWPPSGLDGLPVNGRRITYPPRRDRCDALRSSPRPRH